MVSEGSVERLSEEEMETEVSDSTFSAFDTAQPQRVRIRSEPRIACNMPLRRWNDAGTQASAVAAGDASQSATFQSRM